MSVHYDAGVTKHCDPRRLGGFGGAMDGDGIWMGGRVMNDAEDNQAATRIIDRIVDRIVDHVIVTTNNDAPGAEMVGDGRRSCPSCAIASIRKHLEG